MIHFLFDGPPGPEGPRFIESETPDGKSVNAGEWHERPDGFWELRVYTQDRPTLLNAFDDAITEARAALQREVTDKARGGFAKDEIASAMGYRRGFEEGLCAGKRIVHVTP